MFQPRTENKKLIRRYFEMPNHETVSHMTEGDTSKYLGIVQAPA